MSTDTKIKTLIFNKLTQEQYDNADRVSTEFYLTPDDTDEKLAAKQDKLIAGTNITIEENVISATYATGATGHRLGEVFFSQSSLATDNPGALPGWTSEYYSNASTLYPDLYNFVKVHSELQVTKAQYDSAITTYGECPKYVVDETTTSTNTVVKIQFPQLTYPIYTKQPEFSDVDGYNYANEIGYLDENLTEVLDKGSPAETNIIWQHNSTSGKYNVYSMYNPEGSTGIPAIETDSNYQNSAIDYNYIATKTTTIEGSLRLPKLANYIKMANSTEGVTQKGAGLPDHTHNVIGSANYSGTSNNAFGNDTTNPATLSNIIKPASESNSIYGASDTVQPAHTTLYPWICAYTSTVPASTAQAAEFTGALSGKANTDLSNIPMGYDYVIESKFPTVDDTSWYRLYKSGWLEQGNVSPAKTGDSANFTLNTTITFPKPFADNNYTLVGPGFVIVNAGRQDVTKTATGFTTSSVANDCGTSYWYACGIGAAE